MILRSYSRNGWLLGGGGCTDWAFDREPLGGFGGFPKSACNEPSSGVLLARCILPLLWIGFMHLHVSYVSSPFGTTFFHTVFVFWGIIFETLQHDIPGANDYCNVMIAAVLP